MERTAPRPVTAGGPRSARLSCWSCGRGTATAAEIADLATVRLVAGADPASGAAPAARRFCRGCAPRGPVEEVVCARCGDGPLIAGELTAMNLQVTVAVDAWLAEAGWRLAGPVCPGCVHEMSP